MFNRGQLFTLIRFLARFLHGIFRVIAFLESRQGFSAIMQKSDDPITWKKGISRKLSLRAENGDPVWPVRNKRLLVGKDGPRICFDSPVLHHRPTTAGCPPLPLSRHRTDNGRKWYKRSTEAANKCSRREKFRPPLALRLLFSCRERERES